ncbi:MAG: hypothetical protein ACI8RZ_006283 [Myxococcota bacterium]|jgi:hypothetical protein
MAIPCEAIARQRRTHRLDISLTMSMFLRILTLIIMAIAAIAAGVVAFPRQILGSKPNRIPDGNPRTVPAKTPTKTLGETPAKTLAKTPDPPAPWSAGEDLLRYPRRLSELEQQLAESHQEAEGQAEHLGDRLASMQEKEGRENLAARYREDLALLQRRIQSMRRVLGLVWRTRAILEMRAHLAITARRRPNLDNLPEDQIPTEALDQVADDYDRAAQQVQQFVGEITDRSDALPVAIPQPPSAAVVTDVLRGEVETEKDRVLGAYRQLGERMDHLGDTLAYLSDRCRTRRVFEGSAAGLTGADAGGEALINEVESALSELNDLAEVGELHLADSTLDALAEGISQLEQAGLEVQAEADAAMEVAKLLEQFQS